MVHKLSTFPNLTVQAQYDSLSQVVEYNDLSRKDFDRVLKDPFSIGSIEKTRLVVHEICHYVDHLSTLKGQQLLANSYDAFNAFARQDEYNFWRMMRFYKTALRLKYENYYKISYTEARGGSHTDWSFSSSIGCRYDSEGRVDVNKPIVFNTFKRGGGTIARIPFSVEALWEISAMAEEIHTHAKAVVALDNTDEMIVEEKLFLNQSLEWIYNSELLTYSSAAHLVSSLLQISDIPLAFKLSKTLAVLSLNIPDKYFMRVKVPQSIQLPKDRLNGFRKSFDSSCLYYFFVKNLQQSIQSIITADGIDLERILSVNGLPSEKTLKKEIEAEMVALRKSVLNGVYYDKYIELSKTGVEFFNQRGIASLEFEPEDYLEIAKHCSIVCNDDPDGEIQEWYLEIFDLDYKIREFVHACGY